MRLEADSIQAYPPTDMGVHHYFLGAPSTSMERKCKDFLRSFLCALFDTGCQQLKRVVRNGIPYEAVAKAFHDFFAEETERNDFYQKVIESAKHQRNASAA